MLKHLTIHNIVLVEQAGIQLDEGLNILTGETGSGKSAIMHGLNLAIGERADTALIRRGCEKGIVEAVFETNNPDLITLLHEGGLDHDPAQGLIIRREISTTGKGRIFINNQMAQLAFLRKIGSFLVRVVGQHANRALFSTDYHREVVDLYGSIHPLLDRFQTSYDKESEMRRRLEQLVQQESQRLREIDTCRRELEELDEAQLKPNEEEELFAEYSLLSHTEEISAKIHEVNHALTGDRHPLLALLHRQNQTMEALAKIDPALAEVSQALQTSCIELQEVSHTLRHYQSRLHADPERLALINARLSLLNRLKKKYGREVAAILDYQQETNEKLKRLENSEEEIEELQAGLLKLENETQALAEELTQERQRSATLLAEAVTEQIKALNMPKAMFLVELTRQKRTRDGDDHLEFSLRPNVGEKEISLKEGASGGEISRVLLALQTLLAGKEKSATLIFDEVDANIGGETAAIVGDRLKEISKQHQVICITHFPQVANCADHHLQISKEERDGRTLTLIEPLDRKGRQQELKRMGGIS